MKNYYNDKKYLKIIENVFKPNDIKYLENKTISMSGGTGGICSLLVDSLLQKKDLNVKLILFVRNVEKAVERFSKFSKDKRLIFIECDIKQKIICKANVDFVIHAASYTDPKGYSEHPIDTMLLNFNATKSLIDFAVDKKAKFLLFSSTEIYGILNKEKIDEKSYGYSNPLESRSCYNISKLAAETLCSSYKKEKNLNFIVARLARTFGPTNNINDTKAFMQFFSKAYHHENIILKSSGKQVFSFLYSVEAIQAIIFLLKKGKNGEAYNIASNISLSLKALCNYFAKKYKVKVEFGKDEFSGTGYSKVQKAILDCKKIKDLGFKFKYSLDDAINECGDVIFK